MGKILTKLEDLVLQQVVEVVQSDGNFIGLKLLDQRGNNTYMFIQMTTDIDAADSCYGGFAVGKFKIITDVRRIPDEVIKKLKLNISIE